MALTLVERWVKIGSALVRPSRAPRNISEVEPPGPGTDRDSLVYGTYEPNSTNTGVLPDIVLTAYNTSAVTQYVTLAGGTTISNKIIYGDVKATGSVTLNNCSIVGGSWRPTLDDPSNNQSNNVGCLTLNDGAARSGVVVCIDCTIKPRVEADGRDCVIGRQYELYRCKLSGGVDGAGIYSTGTNTAVKIQGCLIEDLAYLFPDQDHTDGTHNDGIQFQGGRNVLVMGNSIRGKGHKMTGSGDHPKYPWATQAGWTQGSGIIVQRNGTLPLPDSTVIFEKNYIRGFMVHLNIKPGITFVYRDNWHYREVAVGPSWSGYYARFDYQNSVVTGLTGGTTGSNTVSNTTNKWVDGPYINTALTSPRDRGIHFNPS